MSRSSQDHLGVKKCIEICQILKELWHYEPIGTLRVKRGIVTLWLCCYGCIRSQIFNNHTLFYRGYKPQSWTKLQTISKKTFLSQPIIFNFKTNHDEADVTFPALFGICQFFCEVCLANCNI